jgi:AcrR family transcriptional regulator
MKTRFGFSVAHTATGPPGYHRTQAAGRVAEPRRPGIIVGSHHPARRERTTTMEAADPQERAGYRRSTGSRRGEARRLDLLERVTDDLAVNGLVDFSLRRAARSAGTTHKVLLYYFDGVDDLLTQAVLRLRERRIRDALAAATTPALGHDTLAARVRAVWPVLVSESRGPHRVLDQAIGLAMYDPEHYAELGREASRQYLPGLLSLCPEGWTDQRKREVATMILAVLRGFLVDLSTSGDTSGIDAGLEALTRALEREEAADD